MKIRILEFNNSKKTHKNIAIFTFKKQVKKQL